MIAGHRGDGALVREAITDNDPTVRQSAYNALARLGELTPHDLAAAICDPDPTVRLRAATLAGQDRLIAADLRPLLSDSDPSVVEAAAWASGERDGDPDPEIVAMLIALVADHPEPLVRESAVAALGALQLQAAVPAIISACSDKPAIRRRAVLALAPFDGPEVEATLKRALDDKDWQTRQAAEDLLA